jgi:hypothetical protein
VHGLKEVQEELGELIVEGKLPQPGQPAATTYEGDGFLIVRDADSNVVRKAVDTIVRSVHVELG